MKAQNTRLGFLLLFCCLQMAAMAQYKLVLEKPAALKRKQIEVGHQIGIQVKGMDDMFFGELQGVKDNLVFMFEDSLRPGDIERLYVAKPRFLPNMIRVAAFNTALWYPIIIFGNKLADHSLTRQDAVRVGAVVAGALLLQKFMKVFYWQRIRLDKGKWRLKTMPTPESLSGQ